MNIPNKLVILHFTKFSFVFSNNILCFNNLLDIAFKLISKKQVSYGMPQSPVTIPMSRYDIANYLALTTESVSRAITKLKNKQMLKAKSLNTFELCL